MTVFCFICKRHVDLGDCDTADQRDEAMRRFKACGHDDRKAPRLRHGAVGVYASDRIVEAPPLDVPADVVECFENSAPRVDPERLAA